MDWELARRVVEFEYLGERSPILGDGKLVKICYETADGHFLDFQTLKEFIPSPEFSEPRTVA